MSKIVFIGAGSLGFTRGLVRDLLTFDLLKDATIALVDIDAERLSFARQMVEKIIRLGNYPARVIATRNRLIHGYLGIDHDTLWSIIRDDVPELMPLLRAMKSEAPL